MKYEYKILKKDTELSEIEITVPFSEFDSFKEEAYKELSTDIVIPGFRPGKGPRESIERKIGDKLINKAIELMFPVAAMEILTKEDLKPISRVRYELSKFDLKEGIIYKIIFTEYPVVKLGDLSKLKVEKTIEVTKTEDIDMVIKNIIRSSIDPVILKKYESKSPEKAKDSKEVGKVKSKGEVKKGKDESAQKDKEINAASIEFDLSDELVKELGYKNEKTLADMRKQVEERLKDIKEKQAEDKYIEELITKAVEVATVKIPHSLVHNEAHLSENDFNERLKELKLDAEVFLKTQGTTLEEKRKDWEKQAEAKIKTELVLYQIATDHDLDVSEDDIDTEVGSIADEKVRSSYKSDDARRYIRSILIKRKAVEKLKEVVEGTKPAAGKKEKKK